VPLYAGLDRDPPGDQVAGFTWPHDVRKMAAGEAVQARVGDASGKFAAGAGRYDWIPAPDHHERGAIDRIQPWPGVEAERHLALDTMPRQVQGRPPKIGAHHRRRGPAQRAGSRAAIRGGCAGRPDLPADARGRGRAEGDTRR